jgi:hypothetical protein
MNEKWNLNLMFFTLNFILVLTTQYEYLVDMISIEKLQCILNQWSITEGKQTSLCKFCIPIVKMQCLGIEDVSGLKRLLNESVTITACIFNSGSRFFIFEDIC